MEQSTGAAYPSAIWPSAMYLDGAWVAATSGQTFAVLDPASEAELARVPDASAEDAGRAVDAAAGAQGDWARSSPRDRSDLLWRIHRLLLEESESLARTITSEMGKPLTDARSEVGYAAEFFRWFAEQAGNLSGRLGTSPDGGSRFLVSRVPVGPTLLITPWNFPLAMGARKLAPALAAGCTSILKPAEQTPLTMLALAGLIEQAGCPPGVVNVVTTADPGPVVGRILDDARMRKLSFTGSTAVGKLLHAQCSQRMIRTSLELGGNAPLLVLGDADIDIAVEGTMVAKMRNMGQACTAANRIYVARDRVEEFTDRLVARMSDLTLGDGLAPGTEVGPLIDDAAIAKVEELVADALGQGSRLHCGGVRADRPGFFYLPTVIGEIGPSARILREEVFGPVAPVVPVDDEEEMIRLANDTAFGLSAYVFSADLHHALAVADRIESGLVGVNTGLVSNPAAPFGGVKESGMGREGGDEGVDEFLEVKLTTVPSW